MASPYFNLADYIKQATGVPNDGQILNSPSVQSQQQQQNPLAVTADPNKSPVLAMTTPAGTLANPVGSKTVKQNDNSSKTYQNSDQRSNLLNTVLTAGGANNPLAQQKSAIDQQQAGLLAQAQADAGKSKINLSPLAALADAWNAQAGNKTNLAGAAEASAPQDQTGALMKGLQDLTTQKGALSKDTEGALKDMVSGNQTQKYLDQLGGGSPYAAARMDAMRMNAGNGITGDKAINALAATAQKLNRANGILDTSVDPVTGKPTPVTPQMLFDSLQDYQGAIAGGSAAQGSIQKGDIDTLKTKMAKLMQQGSSFGDLRKIDPNAVAQAQGMIHVLSSEINKQGNDRADILEQKTSHVSDQAARQTALDASAMMRQKAFMPQTQSTGGAGAGGGSSARRAAIAAATNQAELDAAMKVQ